MKTTYGSHMCTCREGSQRVKKTAVTPLRGAEPILHILGHGETCIKLVRLLLIVLLTEEPLAGVL